MGKFLLFSLLALLLVPSGALGADDLVDRVTNAMQGCVRTLHSSILSFHWEGRRKEKEKGRNLQSKAGQLAYVKDAAGEFLRTNNKNGFYLAGDPFISADFGLARESWRLVVVAFPAGTRLLAVHFGCDSSEALKKVLPERLQRCIRVLNTAGAQPLDEDECTDLRRKVHHRLNVAGIRYGWRDASMDGIKGCKGTDPSAFILTNPEWLSPDKVRVYTGESKVSHETRVEQASIQNLVYLYGHRASLRVPKGRKLWPSAKLGISPSLLNAETKAWMKENLLNCQPQAVDWSRAKERAQGEGRPTESEDPPSAEPAN